MSSIVSPDRETGIGDWTTEQFIERFKAYTGATIPLDVTGFQTQHAWTEYAKLSAADLAALHTYLMAQPPVSNAVDPVQGAL